MRKKKPFREPGRRISTITLRRSGEHLRIGELQYGTCQHPPTSLENHPLLGRSRWSAGRTGVSGKRDDLEDL